MHPAWVIRINPFSTYLFSKALIVQSRHVVTFYLLVLNFHHRANEILLTYFVSLDGSEKLNPVHNEN